MYVFIVTMEPFHKTIRLFYLGAVHLPFQGLRLVPAHDLRCPNFEAHSENGNSHSDMHVGRTGCPSHNNKFCGCRR